jgi:predicted RNA-binding Zn ribbon-like protein
MVKKHDFIFLANFLCLDFVNTQVFYNGRVIDLIPDFEDLLNWLIDARVLEENEADKYMDTFHGTAKADEVLKQAHELRQAIRTLAENLSIGEQTEQNGFAIEKVNAIFHMCQGYKQIEVVSGEFRESFACHSMDPVRLLLPIAESVSSLLRTGNYSLIRRCENPNCILHFYDISKNHSRRWCSMETCGNRVKVGAHYRRHKKEK